MNVLSLFDGVSCGRIALEENNTSVKKYYASEIDKSAIHISKSNYPDIIRLGDVQQWKSWPLDWSSIDLIMAGSPCQGFSQAGKGLGFKDPRSKLFFVFLEILSHVRSFNPDVKFLLENVKMKKQHMLTIDMLTGVKGHSLNSSLVSLYRRPRVYWYNWENAVVGQKMFRASKFIDFSKNENLMSHNWHRWWSENGEKRIQKQYSCVIDKDTERACAFTTRQYSNWNGNFVQLIPGVFRKLTKSELALGQTMPSDYFRDASQRQTEFATGNGWTVEIVREILKGIEE